MASILCIHGIGQQLKGQEILASEWRGALRDGMRHAGVSALELPNDDQIEIVFFGDLFRAKATKALAAPYTVADLEPGIETGLIKAWLAEAERCTLDVTDKNRWKSGWAFESVQRLAVRLLTYPFFAGLAERFFCGNLRQVSSYLTDMVTRRAVRERLMHKLGPDTQLVVAHSLGSVIAYEALHRRGATCTPAFITLGSPLGLPNVIFDRLDPPPLEGRAEWPGTVRTWTNIADSHDFVASVKELAPLFGSRVRDLRVSNEVLAHDVGPYLTAPETGAAVNEALHA